MFQHSSRNNQQLSPTITHLSQPSTKPTTNRPNLTRPQQQYTQGPSNNTIHSTTRPYRHLKNQKRKATIKIRPTLYTQNRPQSTPQPKHNNKLYHTLLRKLHHTSTNLSHTQNTQTHNLTKSNKPTYNLTQANQPQNITNSNLYHQTQPQIQTSRKLIHHLMSNTTKNQTKTTIQQLRHTIQRQQSTQPSQANTQKHTNHLDLQPSRTPESSHTNNPNHYTQPHYHTHEIGISSAH